MTFLLLQFTNAVLAAASAWIFFRAPTLWDDQALVYSTVAGTLVACLTAVFIGGSLVFSEQGRRSHFIHIALTLAFAGWQGYLLYLAGRELGLLQIIKSRLEG
jgi:hypothetical protein